MSSLKSLVPEDRLLISVKTYMSLVTRGRSNSRVRRLKQLRFRRSLSAILAAAGLSACQIYDQVSREADPYLGQIPDAECVRTNLAQSHVALDPVCDVAIEPSDPRTICTYRYSYDSAGQAEGRFVLLHPTAQRPARLDHRIIVFRWSEAIALPSDTERSMIELESLLEKKCGFSASEISRGWNFRAPRTPQSD